MQYVNGLCSFLGTISEEMGEDNWRDRAGSFHLTTAGWVTMGLVYWFTGRLNDELARAGVEPLDALEVAQLVGHLDWRRTNPKWIESGVAKHNKKGELAIAGAGRSTRAAMFSSVVDEMRAKWPRIEEAATVVLPRQLGEERAEQPA